MDAQDRRRVEDIEDKANSAMEFARDGVSARHTVDRWRTHLEPPSGLTLWARVHMLEASREELRSVRREWVPYLLSLASLAIAVYALYLERQP